MHAPRRAAGTSRRRVRGRRGRYSVCGIARPVAELAGARIRRKLAALRFWSSGAVYLALAVCAFWVIRNSPIVPADPSHGALGMRFTIDDFAKASR